MRRLYRRIDMAVSLPKTSQAWLGPAASAEYGVTSRDLGVSMKQTANPDSSDDLDASVDGIE
jgi:hypothetical protein